MPVAPRKKKDGYGPVKSDSGIPLDYIVVVDAGSSGSRVYVYNWENPAELIKRGLQPGKLRLVKRFARDDDDSEDDDDDDDDSDDHDEGEDIKKGHDKPSASHKGGSGIAVTGSDANGKPADDGKPKAIHKGGDGGANFQNDQPAGDKESEDYNGSHGDDHDHPVIPPIHTEKGWSKKIKPGISSFNQSPHKIGNYHVKYLLRLAGSVVPKSQHFRTPFFLHSTAGMRLLPPIEQQEILENICHYVQKNSNFYLPSCSSHINIIGGDVEGIYGWLSMNYMVGSFSHPEDHDHGKNHTTYGLLDMGGASTQVAFQPNATEIDEHKNNLFDITIYKSDNHAMQPDPMNIYLHSDSFLGFGMYQAHDKYLHSLIDDYKDRNKEKVDTNYPSGSIKEPVMDPCLPKGYISRSSYDEYNVDFTGESQFDECLTSIFPILKNSNYGSKSTNCEIGASSSCLFNELLPAFDFDVNHFYGVSGYWDSIQSLLDYDEKANESDEKKHIKDQIVDYDYAKIYNETAKVCTSDLGELISLNKIKSKNDRMTEEELSQLCFKSSWILNFLHLGLGFPRFGIDDEELPKQFKSLRLIEQMEGSAFTWTLGRALLYSSDEYIQAYNQLKQDENDFKPFKRAGFFHTTSVNDFHYGAEQKNVDPRPLFDDKIDTHRNQHFPYENGKDYDDLNTTDPNWYIHSHRWYGMLIFITLVLFILYFMFGKTSVAWVLQKIKSKIPFLSLSISSNKYVSITTEQPLTVGADLEIGGSYELSTMQSSKNIDTFQLDDDEDEGESEASKQI